MNPRGVTLVELLAAISILVVVTALALPALQNRLNATRLDAAQGQLQAATMAARAEAMRQGQSLVLTAHLSSSGEVELVIAPLKKSDSASGKGSTGGREAASQGRAVGSVWATLPAAIKINAQAPASPGRSERPSKNAADEAQDVRLAVFCPDGSAVTSPVFLADGDSIIVVTVNPWIGGVKFAAFAAETGEVVTGDQDRSKEVEQASLAPIPAGSKSDEKVTPTAKEGIR